MLSTHHLLSRTTLLTFLVTKSSKHFWIKSGEQSFSHSLLMRLLTVPTENSLPLFWDMSIPMISRLEKTWLSLLSVMLVLLVVLWQRSSCDSFSLVVWLQQTPWTGIWWCWYMADKAKGAAANISSEYPLALYLHCTSHSLNLAVVKSLEVQSVRNMIGVINKVSWFFQAHPKRQQKLEEAIDATAPTTSVHKLKDLCHTRWVERIDAVQRFKDLFCSIVCCFELITTEGSKCWSPNSLTDASTLSLAITTTDFVSALVITSHSLSSLKPLTKSLQSESKDIVAAVQEIDILKHELVT